MDLQIDSKVTVHRDTMSRDVRGEQILLDLASGTYFGLEDVGARIWKEIQDGATIKQIIAAIVDEYDVDPARAEQDTLSLIHELAQRNLVSISP